MKKAMMVLTILLGLSLAAACKQPAATADQAGAGTVYTCPMHPHVQQSGPGKCPVCGMNLVPKPQPAPGSTAGQ